MKTSSFPSLRVEPELREAAESVLREGETLTQRAIRVAATALARCSPKVGRRTELPVIKYLVPIPQQVQASLGLGSSN